jgi:hypothetical protein
VIKAYLGQISGKVNINTVQNGQMVRNQLERDDGQNASKTVDDGRDADCFVLGWNLVVSRCANNDGLALSGRHLLKGAVYFLPRSVNDTIHQ